MQSLSCEYSNKITISFNKPVKCGEKLEKNITENHPQIEWNKDPNKIYTIIMFDPDAPSPKNPTKKNFLHWLIINNDKTINSYTPPSPPHGSGNHRYFVAIFEQDDNIKDITEFPREKFDVKKFAKDHNLQIYALTKFVVEG